MRCLCVAEIEGERERERENGSTGEASVRAVWFVDRGVQFQQQWLGSHPCRLVLSPGTRVRILLLLFTDYSLGLVLLLFQGTVSLTFFVFIYLCSFLQSSFWLSVCLQSVFDARQWKRTGKKKKRTVGLANGHVDSAFQ